jgi:hypothetical protein
MTSSMGAGSVTTHVLRNLQKHIDVRSRVGRGPWPFLDGTAMIPKIDGVQMPVVPPSKLACLLIDGAAKRGDQPLSYHARALIAKMRRGDLDRKGADSKSGLVYRRIPDHKPGWIDIASVCFGINYASSKSVPA